MYGLYTPIFLLQMFCVYHAYRNNAEQRWYWLILLFPLIGCIVYLVHSFNNRDTISAITENVKGVVISNYRIDQLEKALRFSDNVTNKVNLADAYAELGRYKEAVDLYSECLTGFMSEDPGIQMKLLYAHFMNGSYAEAIAIGDRLEGERYFKDSEERVVYAWALYRAGKTEVSEGVFQSMNKSFTNYFHRLEYCKFLLDLKKQTAAQENLRKLLDEFEQMQSSERNLKRGILRQVRDLYAENFKK
jgi:hypothetical protein